MRFYNQQHKYYCGIDLHARKMQAGYRTFAPGTTFRLSLDTHYT